MRAIRAKAVLVMTMLMTTAAIAPAQNGAGDQEKGSTGWSGAAKDQFSQSVGTPGHPLDPKTGKEVDVHDQQKARDQPALASGKSLNGPPVQLPPSKTPE
jgi:hypothetical protein